MNSQDHEIDLDDSTDISVCKRRVEDAIKWRKNAKYDDKWSKIIKIYAGQYDYPELEGYSDVIAPNLLFSTANVIVPSVMVNYPKIAVTASKPEDELNAKIVEAVANYYWQRNRVHEEVKLMVKDFVILGHGWCKVTWLLDEEEEDLSRDEWTQAVQDALMQANAAMQQAKQSGLQVAFPSEDQIIASVPQTKMVVKEDRANVERISPFDIYIDPDATRLQNARWIAQRMYVPLQEAQERDDWDKKARKQLKGSAMSEAKKDYDLTFDGEERGKEANFVVVWEYYDLLEKKVCTFADGCSMFLSKPDDCNFIGGHPFVPVWNYSIPEKLYPIGDLESILPLQMELAATRTQMVNDRKRYRRMYMYKPDIIGADGLAALTSSDDNAFIPIDSDAPFSEIIAPIATTALPPEFYNQTAMILDDINLVSGVTEYQRGSVSEIRRTATEASMIQDMSNARSSDKLAIIELTISEIARRCIALTQEFLSTDQVAKIMGSDGSVNWVPYSREDISGEFDFSVEAGSTQPMNETFRRQSAMQLMDAMAPFIQAGVVDPGKLAEHVLRNGFGVKDPSAFMMQAPGMAGMPPGGSGAPGMPGMPPGGSGGPPGGPAGMPGMEGAPPTMPPMAMPPMG